MARPRRHPVRAYLVTALVMLVIGSVNLTVFYSLDAAFFSAFGLAVFAGVIAYFV